MTDQAVYHFPEHFVTQRVSVRSLISGNEFSLAGDIGGIKHIMFSADGDTLTTWGDDWGGKLQLWSARDGVFLRTLPFESPYINGMMFSPDGLFLVVSGLGHFLKVWCVADGAPLRAIDLGNSSLAKSALAFSSDGRRLVGVDHSGKVRTWISRN